MSIKIKEKILNTIEKMNYVSALNIAASMCNHETFSSIKNINEGKAVAICGGGPTLKQYKPINNCLHIALNRALLNNSIPYEWFVADDWDGIDFMQEELIAFDGKKFFGHQIGSYDRQIPESFRIKCNAKRYYTDTYRVRNGYRSKLICDIDKMAIGNMPNIAMSTMQIALFTNPSIIFLVGCDASQGHFVQPEGLSSEQIARHEADLRIAVSGNIVIKMWKEIKAFAAAFYPDTRIVSINPVGLKGIFEDEYQEGYQEYKN